MTPERIGPYSIERTLGSGGMGTVYLAVRDDADSEENRRVALKVLPASLAREEGFVSRFEREMEAMRSLHSPHIVRFIDSGSEDGTYWFAMEYVEGETLTKKILAEKRLPWQEALRITRQVAIALKAAHDAGVVHRDLKPSNLLIRDDGVVKLTDFGVAQIFSKGRLTKTGGVIGTAEYMSPEQARGRRATKQSDLYSLGAVLYAMLTGRPPFIGDTSLEVMQRHQYAQFDRPGHYATDLPFWFEEVVLELLEKEPEKRIPDAYVLVRRLDEVEKKIEISSAASDETQVAEHSTAGAGSTSGSMHVEVGAPSEADIGGATFVAQTVRRQFDPQANQGVIGRLLDNTLVLVLLLLLILVGAYLWFTSGPTDEERFAEAVKVLEGPEGNGWIRVRDEILEPLVREAPDDWQSRAEPYLEQVRYYELKRRLEGTRKPGTRSSVDPKSEAERLLLVADRLIESGELARAERMLIAVSNLLRGDARFAELQRIAVAMRLRLQTRRTTDLAIGPMLNSAFERADAAVQEGRVRQARGIWESIVTLYENDPEAAEYVARARAELESHPAANSTATPDASTEPDDDTDSADETNASS